MHRLSIPRLIAPICITAIGAAATLDWRLLSELTPRDITGLSLLVGLGLLAEYLAIPVLIGSRKNTHSITFLLLYACVLMFGPAATTLATGLIYLIALILITPQEPRRAAFNVAQHVLGSSIAGLAFVVAGGTHAGTGFSFSLLPFAAYVLTWSASNILIAGRAIAYLQGIAFGEVVSKLVGRWGGNIVYDLLATPVSVVIALAYAELGPLGLVLVIFPLLMIRRSYMTTYQLQQANRDLLKALVKAIETRDPYTSGHSLRVSSLAARLARRLHLSTRRIEDIETAALLHDVGKIEAIYTDILEKPGGLSHAEMEIIKSHVDKGVELLTSLSSFNQDIIDAVKHHHERYDGSGYPDGIAGEIIPLGARIIKICDAVDAMLSDRPYRKALNMPEVREQLMLFSEREFDPYLVSIVFRDSLLEEHQEAVGDQLDTGNEERQSSSKTGGYAIGSNAQAMGVRRILGQGGG